MRKEILEKSEIYKVFNDITLKNEIIIFGSDFTANFPFYELAKKYFLSNAIYNRSIGKMTVAEAKEVLESCVLGAKPSKIFYALGEHDTKDENTLSEYEKILHKTKKALPLSKIYLLSLPASASDTEEFNVSLKNLCKKTDTEFINIDYTKPYESIFRQLSLFFRDKKITFCKAFQMTSN